MHPYHISYFSSSGAHSFGRTHCRYIHDRLYNFSGNGEPDPDLSPSLLSDLQKQCKPAKGISDPMVFLNPDSGDGYKFSNSYYKRILDKKAVLGIDQDLSYGNDTADISDEFAGDFEYFRRMFALAISRMGNLGVMTGRNQTKLQVYKQG
ncbi:hypothetical protein AMTR_s00066p00146820 [Amborella trichopoda]|uniref:Plant heme peroxidase family profile domain-containing protein n=1 Tax=Amborella trichopoda TaxID=13333 RepID=U5DFJ6_AMBTC|nr:hypothetical protein AMTR_s00066p00146820 [Amborella trichopoda]